MWFYLLLRLHGYNCNRNLFFYFVEKRPKPPKHWSVLLCSISICSKLSFKFRRSKLLGPCPILQHSLRLCSTTQKKPDYNFCAAFIVAPNATLSKRERSLLSRFFLIPFQRNWRRSVKSIKSVVLNMVLHSFKYCLSSVRWASDCESVSVGLWVRSASDGQSASVGLSLSV